MCVSALAKSVWSFEARGPAVSATGGAGGGEGEGALPEETVPGIVLRGVSGLERDVGMALCFARFVYELTIRICR